MKIAQKAMSWWLGWLLLIVALGFVAASSDYSLGSLQKPGPGMVPRFFAVMLGICAIGVLLDHRRSGSEPMPSGAAANTVVVIAVMTLLYPLALKWLGFLISTFVMVGGVGHALKMSATRSMWLALVSVGASYILFALVLGVPLPDGVLGYWLQ
jgi:putative tricarboxylic transport membrane protein